MTLHGLFYWVALFFVCGGGGLALYVVVDIAELLETRRRRRRGRRLQLERYQAEQTIRCIRREAMCELLETEREYRDAASDLAVIEGTAVEVRR